MMSEDVREAIDGNLTHRKALLNIFRLAIPTAISFCATTFSNTAAFAFIGRHTNKVVQAAHALGYSIGNVLVLMVGLGLINGMDALCPVAIGAGHPEYTFSHLIQAFVIVTGAMIPLIPLIFFSKELLILCKQDPEISAGAAVYLKASLPALFFICIYEALRKFLIYHQHVLSQVVVSLASIPIQVFFLWIFVGLLRLEVTGAGTARSLTWMISSASLLTLTYIKREDFSWSKYQGRNDEYKKAVAERDGQLDVAQLAVESNQGEVECSSSITTTPTEIHKVQWSDEKNSDDSHNDGGQQFCTSDLISAIPTDEISGCKSEGGITVEQPQSETPGDGPVLDLVKAPDLIDAEPSFSVLPAYRQPLHFYKHWWEGFGDFLRIAIPSTFLCIFEWLSFEAQVIEAGYLDATELSALSATQSLGSLIYFVSLSVGVTVNSQVGRYMGQLFPHDGKVVTRAGIIASVCISLPVACTVALARSSIAKLFSSSVPIQDALRKNCLFLALGVVFADSLHGIISGAVKALSLQWVAAILDFFGLLGIMQTIGLVLAFHTPLRGRGFVLGTAIGLYCVDICYFLLLFCFVDWPIRAKYLHKQRIPRRPVPNIPQ